MSAFVHRPPSDLTSDLDGSTTSTASTWSDDDDGGRAEPFGLDPETLTEQPPLDNAALADRKAAQKELSKKLTVVDDQFGGKRLPDMVTEAELEQLAATYSDIRLGRSDIEIDGSRSKDPARFRADLMDDIGDILQTESGRALVSKLAVNPGVDETGAHVRHKTTFVPYLDENRDPNDTGAVTMSPDSLPGIGGNAIVAMNPNHDVAPNDSTTYRSDVALYHEMVHALHFTDGTTDEDAVEASDPTTHALGRGDLWGIADSLAHPDEGIAHDAAFDVSGSEHQAVGLGRHADDPFTEDVYRAERAELAQSRHALDGDRDMPQRKDYLRDTGTYAQGRPQVQRSATYAHRNRRP